MVKWYKTYLEVYGKSFDEISDDSIRKVKRQLKERQNDSPLVSVVLIAHNEERHLISCIWSLSENHCHFPIEIIAVNNNSTDKTEEVLKSLGVTYYNETKKGPGYARQCGLDHAKGKYHTYGLGLKNELSSEFRLSEGFSIKPYVAIGLEYGRVSKIKEKSGEMKLEVKSNDYFSVRPEIGTELAYRHHFGTGAFKVAIGAAYENELGRVANAKNKARVAGTDADWYDLRGEKEDRRGNVKFDLNLGLESGTYGVTANVGYDTKGENLRGGIGLRVKF